MFIGLTCLVVAFTRSTASPWPICITGGPAIAVAALGLLLGHRATGYTWRELRFPVAASVVLSCAYAAALVALTRWTEHAPRLKVHQVAAEHCPTCPLRGPR